MAKKFGNPDEDPNPVVVALISQFLSNHRFESTLRIFTSERQSRAGTKKKNDTADIFGKKLTKGLPQLDAVIKEYLKKQGDESGSSSDDSTSEESSSSSSDGADLSSGSDVEMADEPNSRPSSSSSSSSADSSSESSSEESESESDSDSGSVLAPTKGSTKSQSLKRKIESSSSSSDASDSSSSSDSDSSSARPAKRTKIQHNTQDSGSSSESEPESSDDESATKQLKMATETALPASDSSSSSSSESEASSSSDSDTSSSSSSSDDEGAKPQGGKADAKVASKAQQTLDRASSDSSATIQGDPAPLPPWPVKEETKRSGARPTRLAELSAQAQDGDYLSNQYISYDYADRAYNDLIVTRGKGFTKEKNKKKRGSYRGGTIDTSGGKAFKFDD